MYLLTTPAGEKLAIILPPKTGSRTIQKWITAEPGWQTFRGRHGLCAEIAALSDVVVASIRHPCDVLVSWYHYQHRRRGLLGFETFSDYLHQYVFEDRNQYLTETTLPGAKHADRFLVFENGIERELNALAIMFGLPHRPVGHIGAAVDRKPWQDYYSPEDLALVKDRYKHDFEIFPYE